MSSVTTVTDARYPIGKFHYVEPHTPEERPELHKNTSMPSPLSPATSVTR